MKFPRLNPFYQASLILVAAAIMLSLLLSLTNRPGILRVPRS